MAKANAVSSPANTYAGVTVCSSCGFNIIAPLEIPIAAICPTTNRSSVTDTETGLGNHYGIDELHDTRDTSANVLAHLLFIKAAYPAAESHRAVLGRYFQLTQSRQMSICQ